MKENNSPSESRDEMIELVEIGMEAGAGMTVQTLKIGRREFVLLPKREFERIATQARRQEEQDRQDAGDVAESGRRMKEAGGVTLGQVRKKLGL